ncbi:glycosyltransferase family 2 protein [Lactobacillus taiwanensis]|uniref:glycosyltransferase family 2 protein n=1 Tax=Lactobacillus taiwanensis TaxID=508451 RepID=UPI00272A2995|nr:glycosyltransferase family 2 protein [Lactobacillus taiwanensis]
MKKETKTTVDCVVVTYNRLKLLKECLAALENQTYRISNLYVVDNNSTDDTLAYLKEFSKGYKNLKIIHLNKNLGGAGGFNKGIKKFIENSDSDFVWIMDDDTIPNNDALEKLMDKVNSVSNLGFLASNIVWQDGTPAIMNIPTVSSNWNQNITKGLVQIKSASFVSILFPRKVIEKVGLPITDFFIWGDDVEYTLRIFQAGYKGYLVNDSIAEHKIAKNIGVDIVSEENSNRIKRYYYSRRNAIFTERNRMSKAQLAKWLVKCCLVEPAKILAKAPNSKMLRIRTTYKGTIAGFFFNPKIETVKGNKANGNKKAQ